MAKTSPISSKHVAIDKAQAQMVAIVAAAAFITIFCLVAAKTVFSQNQYQAKIVSAKEEARNQLEANLEAFDDLEESYKDFDGEDPNILEGKRDGTADNDGSNSKIVLNALPSSYDFPALASSLEKIFRDRNLKVSNITGTDDQVNQQGNSSSSDPKQVEIPFTFTISDANYASLTQLMDASQKSIRPIQIDKMQITGGGNNMSVTVDAHTYYQPAKSLKPNKKVIK